MGFWVKGLGFQHQLSRDVLNDTEIKNQPEIRKKKNPSELLKQRTNQKKEKKEPIRIEKARQDDKT